MEFTDTIDNRGSIVVGVSHDTAAFALESIAKWWECEGLIRYAASRELLILADTGGSNGARIRTWKTELQSQETRRFLWPLGDRRTLPSRHLQ